MNKIEKQWTDTASKILVGRKIVGVRYMTKAEAKGMDWFSRPIVLILDDRTLIYPSHDDEGNDGGALFTNNDNDPVIPVIR